MESVTSKSKVKSKKDKKAKKAVAAKVCSEDDEASNEASDASDDNKKPTKKSVKTKKKTSKKNDPSSDQSDDQSDQDDEQSDSDDDNSQRSSDKAAEKKNILTHKEKKELKKKQKMDAEIERISKKGGEGHGELSANFTVAQALKTGGALVNLETAVDIKIDKFSIAAKGNDLFRDASLLIGMIIGWTRPKRTR